MDEALEGLAGGTPEFLAMEGEPGIGKTRLLAEVRGRAEGRGYLVLSGTAAEFERDVPFGVWVDAVDAHVASCDPHESWDAGLLRELEGVLPAARARDGAADSTVADERYRAHRAMRGVLELIAGERAAVIVLDDLHWADRASIELVAALLRRGPAAPVLLAFAFRPGQAPDRLTTALAVPSVTRLTLEPLSQAHASELLGDIDPRSVAAIHEHGGGNPFYLEQLARASRQGRLSGALRHARDGAPEIPGGVPPAVTAALAEELESLSLSARALLNGAAVAGEPFEPGLAAAVAELSREEGLAALDDLVDRDLVRSTDVPRQFRFRHPLVRRAVYESTRGGWRLAAHGRAAIALEARGAAAAERAHHVEQSAAQGDEGAIALLVEAGRATAARAPDAAARWFGAALRLLPAADTERQIELRISLASALRPLGELEACRHTLLEVIDLLPAEAVERRVGLIAVCAGVEHRLGRHEEAHARLFRAWEELPEGGVSPEAAELQIELSMDGFYIVDLEQTLTMGRGGLETARAVGDPALLACALAGLAVAEAAAGEIAPAKEHREEASELIDGLSDADLTPHVAALVYLAWAENYLEHYDAAVAHADRGLTISRSAGKGRLLVPMALVKGYPFELQGRLAEATEVCETTVEATRLADNPQDLFWALSELAWAHYYTGDLDAAIAACEESARIGNRIAGGTMPASGGGPGWAHGCALFEAGEVERAHEIMHSLGPDDLPHKIPVEKCFDWEILALVEIALGRLDEAEGYVVRAEENAAGLGLQVPEALALRARAALLLARAQPSTAAELALESAAKADDAGAGLVASYSRSLAGRALAAAGERERAISELRRAEGELDAFGSLRVRDEMRRELRKLGARAEPRGPATPENAGVASLTKRELEIAGLVTDRRTNKEIAAELFLSGKTIESHLRNVFVKLGVSSRVEVARAVERDRRERNAVP